MRALAPIIIVAFCSLPAFAQTAPSPQELAKENRELKEYIARLERELSELRSKSREQDRRDDLRRRDFDRFRLPLPRIPQTRPSPPPQMPRGIAPAPQFLPPGSQHFRFNGQDVYVIPLK